MVQSSSRDCESAYTTITGLRNSKEKKLNEDVVLIDESSDLFFYGLADGQSGKKYCREGGLETLKTVFQYLRQEGIDRLTAREHVDEIQYEVIRLIRKTIDELASKEKTEKADFSSTLVVIAFDRRTKKYIIIHLGDGGIIGIRKENKDVTMVSPPDNGLTTNYTWLTTSQDALYHLRISFGKIETFSRVLLFSDGATEIAHGKYISERTKTLIRNKTQEEIISGLNTTPIDDATCIIVDFC